MKALGFIETKGLTGNIEATDALLKAANVEFLGSNSGIGSGLTTVVVTGDVGAVEAAVAAAKTASAKVGEFFCSNVIPRPHPELEHVLPFGGPAPSKSKLKPGHPVPLTQALGMVETFGLVADIGPGLPGGHVPDRRRPGHHLRPGGRGGGGGRRGGGQDGRRRRGTAGGRTCDPPAPHRRGRGHAGSPLTQSL